MTWASFGFSCSRLEARELALEFPIIVSLRLRKIVPIQKGILYGMQFDEFLPAGEFSRSDPSSNLTKVKKALGNVVLSDLTDQRIRDYMCQRQSEKASGRTINNDRESKQTAGLAPARVWKLCWERTYKTIETGF